MPSNLLTLLKNRYLVLICVLGFVSITSFFYFQKTFSFHFVDEEDNFVLGMYLNHGEKLYSDLFSHHQPFSYILSAKLQQIAPYENIYQLIERHRLFMIAWSIIWLLIITLRFGWMGFFFAFFYESSKIYLFGNLFLSESLVVFPTSYLIIWFLGKYKVYKVELLFIGFCLSLGFMLLAPIWPLFGFLSIYLFVKNIKCKTNLILLLVGFLPIFLISVYYSNIYSYFYYVFYVNFNYYFPFSDNAISFSSLLKSCLTPLFAFFSPFQTTQTGYVIKIFSLILIIQYIILVKAKKYFLVSFSFIVLGLSNIRYISPGAQEFIGFHFIIWYSNLILINLFLFGIIWNNQRKVGYFLITLFMLVAIVTLNYSKQSLFIIGNKQRDLYINYSRQYDYGQVIKEISNSNDTLFVIPDEWLIYSQSGVKNASYMVNYYAWMTYIPSIRDDVNKMFIEKPPTFLYCDCDMGYFGLEKNFPKYTRLKKEQGFSKLYVLPGKLDTLSQAQKDKLKFFGFSYE